MLRWGNDNDVGKVVAMMEEKLSEFSNKLDRITAKFEQDSQRIEAAENRISDVEDVIPSLGTRRGNWRLSSLGG